MAQHFPWKNRRFLHYSLQCDFPPVFFLFCIGISQLLPSVPSIFCSKKDIPAKHTLSRRYVWKQSHILLHLIFRECRFFAITFKSISAAASCGPAPRPQINTLFLNGVACSVCTVDLASCSNVMQCKENFYSLAGLPLDFPERIHLAPSVSQAKDFLYFIVGF